MAPRVPIEGRLVFECYARCIVIRYKGAEDPRRDRRGAGDGTGEEMFAEVCTCTFNRLITCIPKSGKPLRHARARTRARGCKILNYAIIVARRLYVVASRISPLAS